MTGLSSQIRAMLFGGLVLLVAIAGFFVYNRQPQAEPLQIAPAEPSPTPTIEVTATSIAVEVADTPTPAPTATPKPIRVYITGAVLKPDVYQLPPGSIIKDALNAAGGGTDEADLEAVNLAEELKDQQQIHIPKKRIDAPTPLPVQGGVDPTATPAPAQNASVETASTQSDNSGATIININTASAAQLELLPGVGPAIARRIIDHRTEYGNFISVEDIQNVKGIGTATFEKLKPYITVE